jgi:hypothetical protein
MPNVRCIKCRTLVQGDWNVSANLVSPYKPLGGGWETY